MKPIRILLADDNEEFRKSLAEYLDLRPQFIVVGQAKNGLEAVSLAHARMPDLVLMDISMPEMSGLEAARRIKQLLPGIRVVFITIHEDRTYQSLAEVLGVDGFVCKNSLKKDLPGVMTYALGNDQGHADHAAY